MLLQQSSNGETAARTQYTTLVQRISSGECFNLRFLLPFPPFAPPHALMSFSFSFKVFVDDVDLEEDSRKATKKVKLWRTRLLDCFFSDNNSNKQNDETKVSRRFSAFDFSKSSHNEGEGGRVSSNVVVGNSEDANLDELRQSEPVKRGSIEPSLVQSFSGASDNYGDGESPFFRQSHGDMVPNNTEI